MSSLLTSATRRSRRVFAAVSTARVAASSQDVVLVPTRAGSYALGPVNFTYFDPKSGTYKTITAPRTTIVINAPKASEFNVSPTPPQEESPTTPHKSPVPLTTPNAPNAIPRDPLPGADQVRAPMTSSTLVVWSLVPSVGLLAFWLFLATRRARETDPVRPRREARERLARTVARLRVADDDEQSGLLLAWQRDTAALWQV